MNNNDNNSDSGSNNNNKRPRQEFEVSDSRILDEMNQRPQPQPLPHIQSSAQQPAPRGSNSGTNRVQANTPPGRGSSMSRGQANTNPSHGSGMSLINQSNTNTGHGSGISLGPFGPANTNPGSSRGMTRGQANTNPGGSSSGVNFVQASGSGGVNLVQASGSSGVNLVQASRRSGVNLVQASGSSGIINPGHQAIINNPGVGGVGLPSTGPTDEFVVAGIASAAATAAASIIGLPFAFVTAAANAAAASVGIRSELVIKAACDATCTADYEYLLYWLKWALPPNQFNPALIELLQYYERLPPQIQQFQPMPRGIYIDNQANINHGRGSGMSRGQANTILGRSRGMSFGPFDQTNTNNPGRGSSSGVNLGEASGSSGHQAITNPGVGSVGLPSYVLPADPATHARLRIQQSQPMPRVIDIDNQANTSSSNPNVASNDVNPTSINNDLFYEDELFLGCGLSPAPHHETLQTTSSSSHSTQTSDSNRRTDLNEDITGQTKDAPQGPKP